MTKIKEIEGHVGHFGNGTGASSYVDEVTEARKIAKRVHEILSQSKVPNSLFEDSVSKDRSENIGRLVSHHNKDTDGLIVSYHLNASGNKTDLPIGAEVLYSTQGALAVKMSKAISDAGGFKNRGAKKRTDLGVLRNTKEPAILLEVFFVNSKADVELYKKNFEKICQAIAKVLAEHIGYKLISCDSSTPSKNSASVSAQSKTPQPKVSYRIKSGVFNTRAEVEAAKKKVSQNKLANELYITIHEDKGKFYFQTGTYADKLSAERYLQKMKDLKIIWVGVVIQS